MGGVRQACLLLRSTASSFDLQRAAHQNWFRVPRHFSQFQSSRTTGSIASFNASFSTSVQSGGTKNVSQSSTAAQRASEASRANRRVAKPPGALTILSLWLWRGIYTIVGAAAAGGAVLYVTDPSGTKKLMKEMKDDLDEKIRFFTEPSREQLLPDVQPQYPGAPKMRTLVIDMDETLVHSSYTRSSGWRVAKRPGAEAFLAYLSQFYEIVVFTSGLPFYANPILDRLDPNGYIAHRLYRAETKYERGVHVKDLSKLNRDLSRVIVIDHNMDQVKYHSENTIQVPKWTGDPTDTAFLDLMPFLETLIKEDVEDVREHLATLHNKSVKEGIAAFNANALARHQKAQDRKGGLFFGASSAPPPPPPTEEDVPKGAAWSTLTKTSKLFHPSTAVEIPKEAKDLQKRE